LVAILFGWLPM